MNSPLSFFFLLFSSYMCPFSSHVPARSRLSLHHPHNHSATADYHAHFVGGRASVSFPLNHTSASDLYIAVVPVGVFHAVTSQFVQPANTKFVIVAEIAGTFLLSYLFMFFHILLYTFMDFRILHIFRYFLESYL